MPEEDEDRVALNLQLTREARDGINKFVDSQGITATALFEHWGRSCAADDFDIDEHPQLVAIVEGARQLDAERRRRT